MTTEEEIPGSVLRLRLKKPKHWRWELSTSKSSPHIALPTIQLYDDTGKLLVEAKDNNSCARRSWNCDVLHKNISTTNRRENNRNIYPVDDNLNLNEKVLKRSSSFQAKHLIEQGEFRKKNINCDVSKIPISKHRENEKNSSPVKPTDNLKTNEVRLKRSSSFQPKNCAEKQDVDSKSNPVRRSDSYVPKKYKLRTCNAGTIVVSDDSFIIKPRLHRKNIQPSKSSDSTDKKLKNERIEIDCRNNNYRDSIDAAYKTSSMRVSRKASDPSERVSNKLYSKEASNSASEHLMNHKNVVGKNPLSKSKTTDSFGDKISRYTDEGDKNSCNTKSKSRGKLKPEKELRTETLNTKTNIETLKKIKSKVNDIREIINSRSRSAGEKNPTFTQELNDLNNSKYCNENPSNYGNSRYRIRKCRTLNALNCDSSDDECSENVKRTNKKTVQSRENGFDAYNGNFETNSSIDTEIATGTRFRDHNDSFRSCIDVKPRRVKPKRHRSLSRAGRNENERLSSRGVSFGTDPWKNTQSDDIHKGNRDACGVPVRYGTCDSVECDNMTGIDDEDNVYPKYLVDEPITPASERTRPSFCAESPVKSVNNVCDVSETLNGDYVKRQVDHGDSGGKKQRRTRNKGDRVLEIDKKSVTDIEAATRTLQAAPDTVLLRLVRRLASVSDEPDGTDSEEAARHLDDTHVAMGANVSRHSGKGLSGRRTQSSGNICNGGNKTPNHVSKLLGSCATGSERKAPRHRFCGSLPNHLDGADETEGDVESVCYVRENNNHMGSNLHVTVVDDRHVPKKRQAPPVPVLPVGRAQQMRVPYPPPPQPPPPNRPIHEDGQLELKLQPLLLKTVNNDTALCDQGYGSERSPEDEYPPPIPGGSGSESGADDPCDPHAKYPFITADTTMTVSLTKGSRGLGLSVCGGIDVNGPWPGLIRIKRLFPNQPAASSGLLAPGDLLLAANGLVLTGLTNYEALEVLRTTPSNVVLSVCRPPPEILSAVSPLSDVPPPPPRRDPPCSLNLLPPLGPQDDPFTGEFDITLSKIQGSLGFTLRKEDESALGHYVRALVREPARSDGRIKPGDKIIAVNDVELSSFSHEEAVQFLRTCGNEVKLRLYRDAAQTPVAALSPTDPDPPHRLKPLRQEAMDMLTDLAIRKLSPSSGLPGDGSWSTSGHRSLSGCSGSPRRLRRGQRSTPESECDTSVFTDEKGSSTKYGLSSQLTSESDSFSRKASIGSENSTPNFSSIDSENDKPVRPNFLNLCSPTVTPASRKPKFQFSLAHNAYELNNLDADVLDAPNLTYALKGDDMKDTISSTCGTNSAPEEPASMPPMSSVGFSHKNPTYQSAHPPCGSDSVELSSDTKADRSNDNGSKGLLKWKGVVFTPEGTVDDNNPIPDNQDMEIITVELNRGWNSRLGFSLQQGEDGGTYISAVHADSVAAKDGRLRPGDRLLKVNDEDVENMSTNNMIDLLRIVRGPVSIIIGRKLK